MLEPRPISVESVAKAIELAKHYRLLNEPAQAESICRDIVAVQPDHQEAWVILLLSLSDQFPVQMTTALDQANEVLPKLTDKYQAAYYKGIILERWGRANQSHGAPLNAVEGWIRKAMRCYQDALELAVADDPDPILRWNTCVRFLNHAAANNPQYVQPIRDMHSEYEEVPQRRRK